MKKNLMLLALVAFLYAPSFAQKNLEPHEIDELERQVVKQPETTTSKITTTSPQLNTIESLGGKKAANKGNPTAAKSFSAGPGYELDVDGEGAFRLEDLGGLDFFNTTGGGLLGLLRHSITGTEPIMYLSNFEGELQLYSASHEITMYSDGAKALEADENQNINIGSPATTTSRVNIAGDNSSTSPALSSTVTYMGLSDVDAVNGTAITAPGYGYGGRFTGGYRGVYGQAQGTTYTGSIYGVYGTASNSTTGTSYGVYGSASAGTGGRAYGVYASGDLKVTSQIFIGTNSTQEDAANGYELVVDGQALVEEVKVELSGSWPDYVFEKEYDLMPLEAVENYINENGHLPNIPSAKQIETDGGHNLGDTQRRMLEKVEELTLYMIDLKKENEELKKENKEIKALIQELQNK